MPLVVFFNFFLVLGPIRQSFLITAIEPFLTLPQTSDENICLFCKWLLEYLEMDNLVLLLKHKK